MVEQNRDRLAEVESQDNGKPKYVANADVGLIIDCFRYCARWAEKLGGKVIQPTQNSSSTSYFTWNQPSGVVGQIILGVSLMQVWKLGLALAMGCTVVMKLSEKTPLSSLL